jgi:hypothetical protein
MGGRLAKAISANFFFTARTQRRKGFEVKINIRLAVSYSQGSIDPQQNFLDDNFKKKIDNHFAALLPCR